MVMMSPLETFHLKCQGQVAESLLASLGEQGWCPDLKRWCFSTTLTSGWNHGCVQLFVHVHCRLVLQS